MPHPAFPPVTQAVVTQRRTQINSGPRRGGGKAPHRHPTPFRTATRVELAPCAAIEMHGRGGGKLKEELAKCSPEVALLRGVLTTRHPTTIASPLLHPTDSGTRGMAGGVGAGLHRGAGSDDSLRVPHLLNPWLWIETLLKALKSSFITTGWPWTASSSVI